MPRIHLDTIPLWDSIRLAGECPLCALRRKLELAEAERFLGAAVMEPEVRIQVNRRGFCGKHQLMLYERGNRLGHALMMQTHLQQLRQGTALKDAAKVGEAIGSLSLKDKLGGKGKKLKDTLREEGKKLQQQSEDCLLCSGVEENMRRYLHTFFHLVKNDSEFHKALEASKGFCLPDLGLLLEHAADELDGKTLADFTALLASLSEQNLQRIQEDVDWFIRKFDYRFDAEPWKNSRDAVERSVNKINGWCVGQEPWPEEK